MFKKDIGRINTVIKTLKFLNTIRKMFLLPYKN